MNKAITLEFARQIASVGGNPQEALELGTFAPGELDDPTAAGNSCNTLDHEPDCICTQYLLVKVATPEVIDAAVAGTEALAESSSAETRTSSAAGLAGTGSASLNVEESSDAPFSNWTISSVWADNVQAEACKERKLLGRKRRAALDFDSCSDPTTKFADGLDGRKEASFVPNSDADFSHGSALNIGVISSSICQ